MTKEKAKYFPQTKEELKSLIEQRIKDEGNEVDLNDIDVSAITDMSGLFEIKDFNGYISKWDVSNVKDMSFMFCDCIRFNKDISKWNVSNVTNMGHMFYRCESFNQDLSCWDVSKVNNMKLMFMNCEDFNQDISNWDVSKVANMVAMFWGCESFNQDLSNWNVSKVTENRDIFIGCPIKEEYKPNGFTTRIKEQAKHMAEVLNAYADGKTIEVLLDGEWFEVPTDGWHFDLEKETYRIKKEQKYRPFKNEKECFEEMKKHQPVGWVKSKNASRFYCLAVLGESLITINNYCYKFNECYYHFTFADGQPFGIKK